VIEASLVICCTIGHSILAETVVPPSSFWTILPPPLRLLPHPLDPVVDHDEVHHPLVQDQVPHHVLDHPVEDHDVLPSVDPHHSEHHHSNNCVAVLFTSNHL